MEKEIECDCKMFVGGGGKLCPDCTKKESNLSEKKHRVRFHYDYKKAIFVEDVKEFIKNDRDLFEEWIRGLEFKEGYWRFCNRDVTELNFKKDKLAGKDLV